MSIRRKEKSSNETSQVHDKDYEGIGISLIQEGSLKREHRRELSSRLQPLSVDDSEEGPFSTFRPGNRPGAYSERIQSAREQVEAVLEQELVWWEPQGGPPDTSLGVRRHAALGIRWHVVARVYSCQWRESPRESGGASSLTSPTSDRLQL